MPAKLNHFFGGNNSTRPAKRLSLLRGFTSGTAQLFEDFAVRYADELSVRSIQTIQRLKDSAAVAGDVTDIRIGYGNNIVKNISLKHNHDACKHQRPAVLIKNQLGIQDPNLDRQYRNELKLIENEFKALVLPTDVEDGNFVFRTVPNSH